MDFRIISYNSYLFPVPAVRSLIMLIITPEMHVLEQESFNSLITNIFLTFLFNQLKIFFMDYLVGLQIKKPVTRTMAFRYICLMRMFHTTGVFLNIPDCINDPDFIALDAEYFIP